MFFSGATALRDWAVLFVTGSLLEIARRLLSALWEWSIDSFFVSAVFSEGDVSFQWILLWLSKQPSWKRTRNVQVSTSNFDLFADHLDPTADSDTSRKATYLPAVSESYTFWYKCCRIRITRTAESQCQGWYTREFITMSIMTHDHGILARIVEQAKSEYAEAQKDKISIFISDRYNTGCWRELTTRPKRPLDSIILDPGITDLVMEDVSDFLGSKEWYAKRGIPFRRGYLLYGAPGSGKTSLIHSIAGQLGLDVYVVSLSRSGLDDTDLSELILGLPKRCIALLEDIDAAFHHGLSRESPQGTSTPIDPNHPPTVQPPVPPAPTENRVSLSGLLNALDGIGAQEGRVLFATTNKYDSLDPALCRPGRMDLHIEFKLASRSQAEELFERFYDPSESSSPATTDSTNAVERKRKDGHPGVDYVKKSDLKDLIDLSVPHASSIPSESLSLSSLSPSPSLSEKVSEEKEKGAPERPSYIGVSHRDRGPALSQDQIKSLATQFSQAVPERQLSMASLQGFLMKHKTRPLDAVTEIGAWVEKEKTERMKQAPADEDDETVGGSKA